MCLYLDAPGEKSTVFVCCERDVWIQGLWQTIEKMVKPMPPNAIPLLLERQRDPTRKPLLIRRGLSSRWALSAALQFLLHPWTALVTTGPQWPQPGSPRELCSLRMLEHLREPSSSGSLPGDPSASRFSTRCLQAAWWQTPPPPCALCKVSLVSSCLLYPALWVLQGWLRREFASSWYRSLMT